VEALITDGLICGESLPEDGLARSTGLAALAKEFGRCRSRLERGTVRLDTRGRSASGPPAARLRRTVAAAAIGIAVGWALAGAGPAPAASDLEVGMSNDGLLFGEPDAATQAVAEWKALGVDVVRVHARWVAIAPGAHSVRRPSGFDPSDPADTKYNWGPLERVIALIRANDMEVMLSITGSGPLWTSRDPARGIPRWKPDPREFARFARAVALKFGADVREYVIWNEPNQPLWLQPQSSCVRRRCTPVAPHLYRGLVRAAYPAIKRVDPSARVLIGGLAPRAEEPRSRGAPLKPLPFLRAMGCVDERYRRLRTPSCRGFRPALGDGLAHHPHGILLGPHEPDPDRGSARLADLPRLQKVLDRLSSTRRLRSSTGRFGLWLTEFGYQTAPPDEFVGVSPSTQSRWLTHAAYLAWRNPRVHNLTQYGWIDEPVRRRGGGERAYSGWQSGLLYADGRPKPARETFPDPFFVDLTRPPRARFWGQVRPGGPHTVTLLRRPPGAAEFAEVATISTDARGYWSRTTSVAEPGDYRFAYELPATEPDAAPVRHVSAIVTVRPG
jgi:hypothetical protein